MKKTAIGAYGGWAAGLRGKGLPELSFRRKEFTDVAAWRRKAAKKALELLRAPADSGAPRGRVERRYEYDGLSFEELSWQLPYGARTEAVFMKPAGARGKLPAVLALHDHGGIKYFGYKKIVRTESEQHTIIEEHQKGGYEGTAWANVAAKRGYAVLAHDAFAFGSRRVRYSDVLPDIVGDRSEPTLEDPESIREYNRFAGQHEHVMAKSLFSAGTTWPGVVLYEDQRALDYLLSRKDVDPAHVACGGLSGGGLRTAYLAGLDHRVKASVCVGFMSTWNDFLLNKSWTHTWMTYAPLLPNYLDFPEVYGIRAPLPTMVLNCTEDPLYTVPEMKKADAILRSVFRKAGAAANYRCSFYPGGHKFDAAMQEEAFDWLDALFRP